MPLVDFRTIYRLAFATLVIAVFVACMVPVPEGLMVFSWQDKLEHVLSFLGLAALGCLGWPERAERVAVGLTFYGGLIEIAQSLTSWRSGDVFDWLADTTGVAIGVGLVLLRQRLQARRRTT
ncbi:MAG: VanZ family protein [Rhodocyclaceae bacterium]|nr:VanZ family protein [Rhodocyclaceae bacterium]MCP5232077.1 VanZ family protein [Zoogloeaceae bacterium]MCB1912348.1 VanZ family protein [Rhodocyclaceae bacterium]MCP5241300.1 VanZ family protein [Zoogloeaceae bacterium]MCP5255203.1 VanZ family protein [Zoogloeaceae bacterium]